MPPETKQSWFKETVRKFIMGFQLISSLALGIFVIAVLYFAMNYFIAPSYTPEQVLEAQKIGNWELPDSNFVLKNIENVSVGNKVIGAVTVKDKQSGNMIMVFDVPFSQVELLKIRDTIKNQLLEKYNLGKYYPKGSELKIGPIGEEFVYISVGWSSRDGFQSGLVGSLDCIKNRKIGSVIMAVAYNVPEKYDEARVLRFVNSINCPAVSDGGGENPDVDINTVDTDKDGLTDKVEKMLLSDPFKTDTDNDGIDDFTEIQTGHSPSIPRPWDEYTAEEFDKVKRDIKYISIDVYDKLFPAK